MECIEKNQKEKNCGWGSVGPFSSVTHQESLGENTHTLVKNQFLTDQMVTATPLSPRERQRNPGIRELGERHLSRTRQGAAGHLARGADGRLDPLVGGDRPQPVPSGWGPNPSRSCLCIPRRNRGFRFKKSDWLYSSIKNHWKKSQMASPWVFFRVYVKPEEIIEITTTNPTPATLA